MKTRCIVYNESTRHRESLTEHPSLLLSLSTCLACLPTLSDLVPRSEKCPVSKSGVDCGSEWTFDELLLGTVASLL